MSKWEYDEQWGVWFDPETLETQKVAPAGYRNQQDDDWDHTETYDYD